MEIKKIITPQFLQKLEILQIMSKKIIRGNIKGERTSVKRGRSVECADYRSYVFGDEIKIIDWNIYGRLDKLFVKLFVEEEELTLYILIDRSLSMSFGTPPKMELSVKIAAALSYITLANFDRVSLGVMDISLSYYQAPIRGKNQVFQVFDFLGEIVPHGETSLSEAIKKFAARKLRPGMVVIISDFFDSGDFKDALKFLTYQKHDLFLIQVLDSNEIDPQIGGDLKLVDMETGETREVTITDQLLEMYKKTLNNYCGNLRSFCHGIGAGYILAPTSIAFEDLVMEYLRKGKLLR